MNPPDSKGAAKEYSEKVRRLGGRTVGYCPRCSGEEHLSTVELPKRGRFDVKLLIYSYQPVRLAWGHLWFTARRAIHKDSGIIVETHSCLIRQHEVKILPQSIALRASEVGKIVREACNILDPAPETRGGKSDVDPRDVIKIVISPGHTYRMGLAKKKLQPNFSQTDLAAALGVTDKTLRNHGYSANRIAGLKRMSHYMRLNLLPWREWISIPLDCLFEPELFQLPEPKDLPNFTDYKLTRILDRKH